VAVNARTPRRRAALAFLEFVTSSHVQHLIRSTGCSLPARISAAEALQHYDPRIHPGHHTRYVQALHENGHRPPFYTTAAAELAHHELLLAFGGLEDVATACRRADAQLEALALGQVHTDADPHARVQREAPAGGWAERRQIEDAAR
jgi:hypothetical protein